MKLSLKLSLFFSIVLLLCCSPVLAQEYEDTLRVGICYGSDVQKEITFQSDDGFSVGYTSGRDFYKFAEISKTSVKATKASAEIYSVIYSKVDDYDQLTEELEFYRDMDIAVFPAYYDSSYCVVGGIFQNNNDALWEAQNGAQIGEVAKFSANTLMLTDKNSEKVLFLSDSSSKGLGVFSIDREDPDALITISGSAKGTYRGGFECKALSSDGLTLVNIVPVESYLYSVVSREMSSSWPIEALKVQAVCARNFALRRINYHSKYGFDVCRTVCCQAYSTTADQSESVHTAVDETRGELLFYKNELVQAVYSSSMGSSTESVENVWGTPFPYLVSVENPYEDTENIYNGKWTKKLTKARATEIMNSRGYSIGDVIEIKALEYTEAGRVLKLLVKGTNGEKIFQRESCRTIFGEVTYSQKFTVSTGGVKSYPCLAVTSNSKAVTKTFTSVAVLGGNNKISTVSGTYVATDGHNKKKYESTATEGSPDTFVFSGEGWGHGVGMSQYGAKGMAEAGFDYEEILTHYYQDTHLEQAY